MKIRITGSITRMVLEPVEDDPDALALYFQPDPHCDLTGVDGKHRRASGELVVQETALRFRKVGDRIECELSDEADPLERTLRVV